MGDRRQLAFLFAKKTSGFKNVLEEGVPGMIFNIALKFFA